jgi:hypothetical protein
MLWSIGGGGYFSVQLILMPFDDDDSDDTMQF